MHVNAKPLKIASDCNAVNQLSTSQWNHVTPPVYRIAAVSTKPVPDPHLLPLFAHVSPLCVLQYAYQINFERDRDT